MKLGTHLKKKTLFVVVVSAFSCLGATCGRVPGPEIKVYQSRPDLGGAHREQAQETIPYDETELWRMLVPSDWEALLNFCLAPEERIQAARRFVKKNDLKDLIIHDPEIAKVEIERLCQQGKCQSLKSHHTNY